MNLNVVNVVIFGIGAILVYAAVKDTDPRSIVQQGLGKPASGASGAPSTPPATFLHQSTPRPTAPVVSV